MGKQKSTKERPVTAIGQQIVINYLIKDGVCHMDVIGFPANHNIATTLFNQAQTIVNEHFIGLAKKGKLDENNQEIGAGLLIPDKRIVLPH